MATSTAKIKANLRKLQTSIDKHIDALDKDLEKLTILIDSLEEGSEKEGSVKKPRKEKAAISKSEHATTHKSKGKKKKKTSNAE